MKTKGKGIIQMLQDNKKKILQVNQNKKLLADGAELFLFLPSEFAGAVFFDPQYRQQLDVLKYGNKNKQKERIALPQMSNAVIVEFLNQIQRVLKPSGYVFFWVDKFILAEGIHNELMKATNDPLNLVDLITWHKLRIGNGYRTRRSNEFLTVWQKKPKTTKNWIDHALADTWGERIDKPKSKHTHTKPNELIKRLIQAVTLPGDYIVDPCAGSFLTLDLCLETKRNFIGCDISPNYGIEKVTWSIGEKINAR